MSAPERIRPSLDWQQVDTVLLDMDGTLLDRHFDDYFWHSYVPENYALAHDLEIDEARHRLRSKYDRQEGTLAWTNLDFWSQALGLDIPALKRQVDSLVAVHPYVIDFMEFCRREGKYLCLVTNAHRQTLEIKMARASLLSYCDRVICAEEIGLAKEAAEFWTRLQQRLNYDKRRTMLADDTERVLDAASRHGLAHLIHVARASSRSPLLFSRKYPSIVYFKELLPLVAAG